MLHHWKGLWAFSPQDTVGKVGLARGIHSFWNTVTALGPCRVQSCAECHSKTPITLSSSWLLVVATSKAPCHYLNRGFRTHSPKWPIGVAWNTLCDPSPHYSKLLKYFLCDWFCEIDKMLLVTDVWWKVVLLPDLLGNILTSDHLFYKADILAYIKAVKHLFWLDHRWGATDLNGSS